MTAYAQLEAHFAHLDALEGAQAILHWDSEVMLPPASVDVRAEQLSALASLSHAKITDPALPELLDKAQSEPLNAWQSANLREMRRQIAHATALSDDLVQALSRTTTQSEHAWREARQHHDYAGFLPLFEQVLRLTREAASAKAEALSLSPYDALLDSYDPAMRSADIDGYFAPLETFLPDFVQQVIEKQKSEAYTPIAQPIAVPEQQALSRLFMEKLGFDFTRGRADVSTHPFCGGVAGDIRLTSRFDEANFVEGLYATFHETGHALYEMGLPAAWRSQPAGKARGMSLHESQSLLVEMQLCLRPSFLRFALGVLRTQLTLDETLWSEANLQAHLTRVRPSFIRVTADEVTYPLHVMLRYKLEKALLSGNLPLADLPAAWDEEMQTKLGIRPKNVAEDYLQDTHWPGGAFGYFPTYSIGAMIAAQLMDAAQNALPALDGDIERGDFSGLFGWLREHVHAKGSLLSTQDLVKEATGKALDASVYKQHLIKRYLG